MMATIIVNTLISGLLVGIMYGMTGIGLTFTMGFGKTMNVAQGTLIVLGSFILLSLYTKFHMNPFLGLVVVIVAFGLLGGFLDRVLLTYLRSKSDTITLLVLFGVAQVITNITSWVYSANTVSLTTGMTQQSLQVGPIMVSTVQVWVAIVGVVLMALLWAYLRSTAMGKMIRATAQSEDAMALCGLDVRRARTMIFVIGVALAGIAGFGLAMLFPFSPQDQDAWLIISFVVVVLGGVDNLLTTLAAGVLLGVLQTLAGLWLPFSDQNLVVYAVLALALIWRSRTAMLRYRSI